MIMIHELQAKVIALVQIQRVEDLIVNLLAQRLFLQIPINVIVLFQC